MPYARTLDSATVPVHNAVIDPAVFVPLAEVGIKNKCYELTVDASEDVVSFSGSLDDTTITINSVRYMKAVEKGPTHVRTYDFLPDDVVVAHYHCGIPPEPSAIDVETMKLALRAQLMATLPGRPRVFGIISPTVAGSSFCLSLSLYEPVPKATIAFKTERLRLGDLDFLEGIRKGFVRLEEGDSEYYLTDLCEGLERGCYPFRYGSVPEIVLEDFIFILSYSINTKKKKFPYAKVSPSKAVVYEVEVANFDAKDAVIRGLVWRLRGASTRGR
ncbi:hypothetical protein [Ignicoccus hospitalis]|uniref:hypothetical protein n=1 Tax=Ignicoccus hospitalis TaxID=160233 RepID=UPI000326A199|nr:hypothetical protein [Ignicoccus hospitalis]HIH90375.1 hypothetical protein [Desulfurococcaceae archaeon]